MGTSSPKRVRPGLEPTVRVWCGDVSVARVGVFLQGLKGENPLRASAHRMAPSDRTSMGGPGRRFETTRWTEILRARAGDETDRRALLEDLLRRYWKPVYGYLRRKGHGNADAKDLTQGFFHEVVLGRGLVRQADREKGRFRTFLLTALDRYVADVQRAGMARKRRPEGGLLHLDQVEDENFDAETTFASPEEAFQFQWVSALLDEVLGEVRDTLVADGKGIHWQLFRRRILEPIFEQTDRPPLADLCAAHDIRDIRTASNMVTTVKRKFRVVLQRRVGDLVGSDAEIEEEIQDLMAILAKGRAAP